MINAKAQRCDDARKQRNRLWHKNIVIIAPLRHCAFALKTGWIIRVHVRSFPAFSFFFRSRRLAHGRLYEKHAEPRNGVVFSPAALPATHVSPGFNCNSDCTDTCRRPALAL